MKGFWCYLSLAIQTRSAYGALNASKGVKGVMDSIERRIVTARRHLMPSSRLVGSCSSLEGPGCSLLAGDEELADLSAPLWYPDRPHIPQNRFGSRSRNEFQSEYSQETVKPLYTYHYPLRPFILADLMIDYDDESESMGDAINRIMHLFATRPSPIKHHGQRPFHSDLPINGNAAKTTRIELTETAPKPKTRRVPEAEQRTDNEVYQLSGILGWFDRIMRRLLYWYDAMVLTGVEMDSDGSSEVVETPSVAWEEAYRMRQPPMNEPSKIRERTWVGQSFLWSFNPLPGYWSRRVYSGYSAGLPNFLNATWGGDWIFDTFIPGERVGLESFPTSPVVDTAYTRLGVCLVSPIGSIRFSHSVVVDTLLMTLAVNGVHPSQSNWILDIRAEQGSERAWGLSLQLDELVRRWVDVINFVRGSPCVRVDTINFRIRKPLNTYSPLKGLATPKVCFGGGVFNVATDAYVFDWERLRPSPLLVSQRLSVSSASTKRSAGVKEFSALVSPNPNHDASIDRQDTYEGVVLWPSDSGNTASLGYVPEFIDLSSLMSPMLLDGKPARAAVQYPDERWKRAAAVLLHHLGERAVQPSSRPDRSLDSPLDYQRLEIPVTPTSLIGRDGSLVTIDLRDSIDFVYITVQNIPVEAQTISIEGITHGHYKFSRKSTQHTRVIHKDDERVEGDSVFVEKLRKLWIEAAPTVLKHNADRDDSHVVEQMESKLKEILKQLVAEGKGAMGSLPEHVEMVHILERGDQLVTRVIRANVSELEGSKTSGGEPNASGGSYAAAGRPERKAGDADTSDEDSSGQRTAKITTEKKSSKKVITLTSNPKDTDFYNKLVSEILSHVGGDAEVAAALGHRKSVDGIKQLLGNAGLKEGTKPLSDRYALTLQSKGGIEVQIVILLLESAVGAETKFSSSSKSTSKTVRQTQQTTDDAQLSNDERSSAGSIVGPGVGNIGFDVVDGDGNQVHSAEEGLGVYRDQEGAVEDGAAVLLDEQVRKHFAEVFRSVSHSVKYLPRTESSDDDDHHDNHDEDIAQHIAAHFEAIRRGRQ